MSSWEFFHFPQVYDLIFLQETWWMGNNVTALLDYICFYKWAKWTERLGLQRGLNEPNCSMQYLDMQTEKINSGNFDTDEIQILRPKSKERMLIYASKTTGKLGWPGTGIN